MLFCVQPENCRDEMTALANIRILFAPCAWPDSVFAQKFNPNVWFQRL